MIELIQQFAQDVIHYDFLRNALMSSIVIGVVSGVVGCFIILQGMALIGDAISHAVMPGVAISYMLGINYFYGAVVAGILTAVGITYVEQNSRIKSDSAIGIVFSSMFALGVILISKAQSAIDLTEILFGNVLTVRDSDRYITYIVAAVVLTLIYLFYKELKITIFDPNMAQAYGLPVKWINYGLMLMLTLVSVASLQTVGVILVVALLITPASTAYLLTDQLHWMIVLSACLGVIASVIGLFFSFEYNLPSGAVIVLVSSVFFALAFIFSPKSGLFWKLFNGKDSL